MWNKVRQAVAQSQAITWDECHKIYVLLDEEQVRLMGSYGYKCVPTQDTSVDEVLTRLHDWYNHSCGLRFIHSVRTTENPNEGFTVLIEQEI